MARVLVGFGVCWDFGLYNGFMFGCESLFNCADFALVGMAIDSYQ